MLILTRRVGETLLIGSDVTVTVLSMQGRSVRVGIAAPKGIPVHREEVFTRIQREAAVVATEDALQVEAAGPDAP